MQAGTSHWPYTWSDCEMAFAIRRHQRNGGYCQDLRSEDAYDHGVDCTQLRGHVALMDGISTASRSPEFASQVRSQGLDSSCRRVSGWPSAPLTGFLASGRRLLPVVLSLPVSHGRQM